jgi:hypothetical protein
MGQCVSTAQVSSSLVSTQLGDRFCAKAAIPSAASGEANSSAIFSAADA